MKDYLFLFDIDGTIMDSNGYGKKAFLESFEKLFDKSISYDVSFLGGIDNVIFKELYKKFNLNENELNKCWKEFQKVYIKSLAEYSKTKEWLLYPNVYETVKFLSIKSNVSIVTGNIEKGAKIKLKKFSLDKFFPTGGYGDKANARIEFIGDAIKHSEKFYNKKFNYKKIYLFGDTEKDVNSANKCGINSVLIDHNGKHKTDALKWNAGFHGDFKNIDRLLKFISSNNKNNGQKIYYF